MRHFPGGAGAGWVEYDGGVTGVKGVAYVDNEKGG